jgi:hypothetical protein
MAMEHNAHLAHHLLYISRASSSLRSSFHTALAMR